MPPAAYFLGKIWLVLATGALETVVLLLVGTTLYDVDLPSDPGKWADFAWIFVLGLTACALLGIAISTVPKSGRSATSVVVLPFLVLQFISGVYIAIGTIPDWMLNIGALFPSSGCARGCAGCSCPSPPRSSNRRATGSSGGSPWCSGHGAPEDCCCAC